MRPAGRAWSGCFSEKLFKYFGQRSIFVPERRTYSPVFRSPAALNDASRSERISLLLTAIRNSPGAFPGARVTR